jgi:hypothetical protein
LAGAPVPGGRELPWGIALFYGRGTLKAPGDYLETLGGAENS